MQEKLQDYLISSDTKCNVKREKIFFNDKDKNSIHATSNSLIQNIENFDQYDPLLYVWIYIQTIAIIITFEKIKII